MLVSTEALEPSLAVSVVHRTFYAWSLGASLGPIANLGLGSGDFRDDFYAGGGARLNIFADFMYKEAQQIGLQGYFGVSNLGPQDSANSDPLNILDLVQRPTNIFRLAVLSTSPR